MYVFAEARRITPASAVRPISVVPKASIFREIGFGGWRRAVSRYAVIAATEWRIGNLATAAVTSCAFPMASVEQSLAHSVALQWFHPKYRA
jgi:hypothetical protein